MTVLQTALALGVACSWSYWLLALRAAVRFRRLGSNQAGVQPPVSVLKPLCGMDAELRKNLTSFVRQEYAEYEVIFVALDARDPALAVAREVADAHPTICTTVLSDGSELGSSRKVSNLAHAMAVARHDVIVLADSDIRVEPDYLKRVTAPFSDDRVGVLTCLYRAVRPSGLAARLEALSIGADFMPGVLVNWILRGASFGFGSTLVIRRAALDAVGGFAAIGDEIADDYRLAEAIRRAGYHQPMSDHIVDCVLGPVSLRASWERRIRWARTIRSLQPVGYLGMGITHGSVLATVYALTSEGMRGWPLLALTLSARMATAIVTAILGTRDHVAARNALLLPLSDLVSFAVWLAGLAGRRVAWRGHTVDLTRPN